MDEPTPTEDFIEVIKKLTDSVNEVNETQEEVIVFKNEKIGLLVEFHSHKKDITELQTMAHDSYSKLMGQISTTKAPGVD